MLRLSKTKVLNSTSRRFQSQCHALLLAVLAVPSGDVRCEERDARGATTGQGQARGQARGRARGQARRQTRGQARGQAGAR